MHVGLGFHWNCTTHPLPAVLGPLTVCASHEYGIAVWCDIRENDGIHEFDVVGGSVGISSILESFTILCSSSTTMAENSASVRQDGNSTVPFTNSTTVHSHGSLHGVVCPLRIGSMATVWVNHGKVFKVRNP
jgi:hypothetical protein